MAWVMLPMVKPEQYCQPGFEKSPSSVLTNHNSYHSPCRFEGRFLSIYRALRSFHGTKDPCRFLDSLLDSDITSVEFRPVVFSF